MIAISQSQTHKNFVDNKVKIFRVVLKEMTAAENVKKVEDAYLPEVKAGDKWLESIDMDREDTSAILAVYDNTEYFCAEDAERDGALQICIDRIHGRTSIESFISGVKYASKCSGCLSDVVFLKE